MRQWLIVTSIGLTAACGQTATTTTAPAGPLAASAHTASASAPPETRATARFDVPPPEQSADDADGHVIRELQQALALYQQFIDRAGNDENYAEAVARSRERMTDIRDTLIFLEQGRAERAKRRP